MITDEQFEYEHNNVKEFKMLNPLFTKKGMRHMSICGIVISLAHVKDYREKTHIRSVLADAANQKTSKYMDGFHKIYCVDK